MSMRTTGDLYGGLTPIVDKLIGDAFPAVKAVSEALPKIDYLVYNMEAISALSTADLPAVATAAEAVPGLYAATLAAKNAAVAAAQLPALSFTPEQFGAKNDGTTDDTAALNAAWAMALSQPNGGTVELLPGAGYMVRSELAWWFTSSKSFCLRGKPGARLINGLTDMTQAMIRFTNPAIPRTNYPATYTPRCGAVLIEGITFNFEWLGGPMKQRHPPFLEMREASGLTVRQCVFLHYSNGTAIRLSGMNNCYWDESVFVWGAGHMLRTRSSAPGALTDIDAMATATFSMAANSTTLSVTNGVSVFDATKHVGRRIYVNNNGAFGQTHVIASVTNGTTAVTSTAAEVASTNTRAGWGPVNFSFSANSATGTPDRVLSTAEAADLVGRMIILPEARDPDVPFGSAMRADLPTWILSATTSSITVRNAPTYAIAARYCPIDPAVVVMAERWIDGGYSANADFTMGVKTEECIGLSMYVEGVVGGVLRGIKCHPANEVAGWGDFERSYRLGAARLWISDSVSLTLDGTFEGAVLAPEAIKATGIQGLLSVEGLRIQACPGSPALKAVAISPTGVVNVRAISAWNSISDAQLSAQLATDGTGRISRTGPLTSPSTILMPPVDTRLVDGSTAFNGNRVNIIPDGDYGSHKEFFRAPGSSTDLIITDYLRVGSGPQTKVVTAARANDGTLNDILTLAGEYVQVHRQLALTSVPTAATGLGSGSVWRDAANGNVLKIVP